MKVTVLTGGVGGAKLVLGLTQIMPPADITAIINTGDDFVHLGLPISPDIDTLLYTLSGKANAEQGWGREGEGWAFMAALKSLGGADWFNLGDGDLALHIMRLAGGTLSETTARFAASWGIGVRMLPMSDDRVATVIESDIGKLPFQNYFVEHRCAPVVHSIEFSGAQAARPATGVTDALSRADVILIAPSNPWLSVDPILAVPGIADALRAAAAPVVAVSPLVGGTAVKGPTAKLMAELGLPVTNASIAAHYQGLIGGLLIDDGDDAPDLAFARTETLMLTLTDRARVAQAAVNLALSLRR
jgi:LPPG:FO 2-phospho-L-lactate transferase